MDQTKRYPKTATNRAGLLQPLGGEDRCKLRSVKGQRFWHSIGAVSARIAELRFVSTSLQFAALLTRVLLDSGSPTLNAAACGASPF